MKKKLGETEHRSALVFNRFTMARRELGRADGMPVSDFAKLLSQEWRAMSEAEKEAY